MATVVTAVLVVGAGVLVVGPGTGSASDGGDRPTPVGPDRSAQRVAETHTAAGGGPSGAAPSDGGVSAQEVLNVTTTTDGGAGSLREAVETLAVNGGGDTVVLQAGQTYTLTCAQGGDLSHGNTPLTISGNGSLITMASGCNERIMHNGSGALEFDSVQLSNVNITVGGSYAGGLVLTGGDLTLSGVTVAGNHIHANGTSLFEVGTFKMTTATNTLVTDTTIDDATNTCGLFCTWPFVGNNLTVQNTTINAPGTCGIFCSTDVTLTGSSISNTTFSETGGSGSCGIFCSNDVTLTNTSISNTTFTDIAGFGSCGLFCSGDVTLTNSFVSGTTFNDVSGNCAVFCSGDVTMTNSAVDNTTETDTGAHGNGGICGGVFCSGDVTMTDSRVTNTSVTELNSDADVCGGVFCSEDTTLVRSSVTGTRLSGPDICGGVFCSGDVTITNSTIADNLATSTGGESTGVFDARQATFVYVTFVGNQSAGQPALDAINSFTTFGSVLSDSGPGGNCRSGLSVASNGYNWADDSSCGLAQTGDVENNGGNPLLAPLGNYGGPGPTRPPVMGSPLLDKVDCSASGAGGITIDERGVTRPQGSACDVGAVEVRTSSLVVSKSVAGAAVGGSGYTFNVSCNDGTNVQVTVPDMVHGGTSAPVTGIKFGATCIVVEVPVNAAPVAVTYSPAGVDTTGMLINQDGQQFTVTVTNAYIVIQPTFTG